MTSLKKAGKISIFFVLLGNPVGIFLFWVGMIVIPAEGIISIESVINNLVMGIGGSPIAIILGSIVGIPLSFANSIVFIILARSQIGHKSPIASGAFSGAFIPALLFTSSYLYNAYYPGLVGKDEWYVLSIMFWLIISSSITGLILGKILRKDFTEIGGVNCV